VYGTDGVPYPTVRLQGRRGPGGAHGAGAQGSGLGVAVCGSRHGEGRGEVGLTWVMRHGSWGMGHAPRWVRCGAVGHLLLRREAAAGVRPYGHRSAVQRVAT
jgi:hypothetical protein